MEVKDFKWIRGNKKPWLTAVEQMTERRKLHVNGLTVYVRNIAAGGLISNASTIHRGPLKKVPLLFLW